MIEMMAAIDRRIQYCVTAAKARPHEQSQWFTTQKQFETLRDEIESGLHGEAWIRWTNPAIPCAPDTQIEIRKLDGSTAEGRAGDFTWSAQCGWATIVEWREISPAA